MMSSLSRLLVSLCFLNSGLAFCVKSRTHVKRTVHHHVHQEDLSSFHDDRIENDNVNGFDITRRTALIVGASLTSLGLKSDNACAKNGQSKPSSNALLQSNNDDKAIVMPLIAYSFYKTSPEQAPRGMALALRAGVRHFDLATDYGNFNDVAPVLKQYWNADGIAWNFDDEKEELVQLLDKTNKAGGLSKQPRGKKGRRQDVFLTYKLSNSEQSTDPSLIRSRIEQLTAKIDTSYLDLVCLHSALPGRDYRIATYKALLQLKEEGLIRSVGVCNFGLCHLKELKMNGLPLPSVNQLEISPFNLHAPIVQFCKENNVQVTCASWSKLSSVSGPVEQWAELGNLAKVKGVTKAQILVRWALQKGFGCAPRSGTGSKLERIAIAENSYGGVVNFNLSEDDMILLDSLNVNYKTGKLGRRDGWKDEDVANDDWDPTEVAC